MIEQDSQKSELQQDLLVEALKIAELDEKIPKLLWEQKDENKDFIFQYIEPLSENMIKCQILEKGKRKDIVVNIAPSSLRKQFDKLEIKEEDIFEIRFLGKKVQEGGSGYEFKSFIVKKFDLEKKSFFTSKSIKK